jgi:hypothetical protein
VNNHSRAFPQTILLLIIILIISLITSTPLVIGAVSFVRSGGVTGSSFSFDIGSAGTDRLIVVIVGDEQASGQTDLTGVTVDGKSCNLVTISHNTQDPTRNHQEMWYCDEDDLGSSNGSVTVAISGDDGSWAIHAHLYIGVSQSGPIDFQIDNTSDNQFEILPAALDIPANGFVVFGAGNGNLETYNDNDWDTNPTEGSDDGISPEIEMTETTDSPNPTSAVLATAYWISNTSAQTNRLFRARNSISTNRGTGIIAAWDLMSTDNTAPNINFVNPTTNSSNISQSYIEANITATDETALDTIIVYLYNTTGLIQSNVSGTSPLFINLTSLPEGTYYLNATANDTSNNINNTQTRTIVLDSTPPASVTNLANQSAGVSWIYWNWTNPGDSDFSENIIFKDGVNVVNTSNNFYNMIGLSAGTNYTITIHTKDFTGNINDSDVNSTAATLTSDSLLSVHYAFDWEGDDINDSGGGFPPYPNREESCIACHNNMSFDIPTEYKLCEDCHLPNGTGPFPGPVPQGGPEVNKPRSGAPGWTGSEQILSAL